MACICHGIYSRCSSMLLMPRFTYDTKAGMLAFAQAQQINNWKACPKIINAWNGRSGPIIHLPMNWPPNSRRVDAIVNVWAWGNTLECTCFKDFQAAPPHVSRNVHHGSTSKLNACTYVRSQPVLKIQGCKMGHKVQNMS